MNFFELKTGSSVEGAEIKAYKHDFKGSKHLYLLAGVHGDEVEGVYILKELFSWLRTTDEAAQIPLIIIPVLNIDGYRAGSRTNSHAVDLNRNLPSTHWTSEAREKKYNPGIAPLSEPENLYLVKLFDKYPPHLVISFHSWVPCSTEWKKLPKICGLWQNTHTQSRLILTAINSRKFRRIRPQNITSVLTFEAPQISDAKGLKEIWEENQTGLKALLSSKLIHSMD